MRIIRQIEFEHPVPPPPPAPPTPLPEWAKRKVEETSVCPAGIGHERLTFESSRVERLYRLAWQDAHQGPMYGGGSTFCDLLSAIMVETRLRSDPFGARAALTRRDRVVAATVVQWLGTNVGRCFVDDVLRIAKRWEDEDWERWRKTIEGGPS